MRKIIVATAFLGIFAGTLTSAFAGYFNTAPLNGCNVQITNTLQAGSENSDVYTLQQMLTNSGYLHATPNGYFGPATVSAVIRFQNDNGLSATGKVGEATRNVINERLCETDVLTVSSYDNYGYNSGVTYVDQYDPYARVISPTQTYASIYNTPQGDVAFTSAGSVYTNPATYPDPTSYYSGTSYPATTVSNPAYSFSANPIITPATSQIQSTGLIYSSNLGYLYGVVPTPGSITITTPLANAFYNEGDTVNIAWSTNNINASAFQVFVENTSTGQSKQVAYVTGNNASFVLTRELLDAVCSGTCNNNQQGNFRFVIATPLTDIAGTTSNFRAMISPITIRRPYSILAAININASKTPVASGEAFRMYVNTPGISQSAWNAGLYGNAVIKLRALCVNTNVQVSIANVLCGQDFTMPVSSVIGEQGVPIIITNSTWFTQDVVFEVNLINQNGQIMGTSQTKVTVNPPAFNW
jgi:peptidoglycan hydrolase-like protein with peptidoglycan-binding domain